MRRPSPERRHGDYHERNRWHQVDQDNGEDRSAQPEVVHHSGRWDAECHRRDEDRQQEQKHDDVLAREAAASQHVGGWDTDDHRDYDHREGHEQCHSHDVGQIESGPCLLIPAGGEVLGQPRVEPRLAQGINQKR